MPRGGARSVSGPAPDPQSLKQAALADKGGWTTLPAEGRSGPPPRWPLTEQTDREVGLWCEMWSRPQALMWERNGQELEVALFVRQLAAAEAPDASTERVKLVRQYLDSLGISIPGMHRNRWKVGVAAAPEGAVDDASAPAPRKSARDRMKVIEGGG